MFPILGPGSSIYIAKRSSRIFKQCLVHHDHGKGIELAVAQKLRFQLDALRVREILLLQLIISDQSRTTVGDEVAQIAGIPVFGLTVRFL